jgi:succinyl-CoA synthetase beta subunit
MDRVTKGPAIIASSQGGMDIETVAHESPEAIVTLPIDINEGLSYEDAFSVASKIGFVNDAAKQVHPPSQRLQKRSSTSTDSLLRKTRQ